MAKHIQNSGFTLIELITVLVVLGVVSVVVSSRFTNTAAFEVQATRDDIVAGLFYAQQTAIARDTATNPIQFVVSSGSITVQENGSDLSSSGIYPLNLPNGISLVPATATLPYDKLGRTTATTFTLTDTSGASAIITVEATGYAH